MASKALTNKKKKEERQEKKGNRNKQKLADVGVVDETEKKPEKCPVFSVQYLGKTPAGGEYGREFIAEPVETLLRLRDRRPKQPESALHISNKGFHFLDKNGPFGKEKHVLIPVHHICYGVADEQHPHVFAIITRTDSSSVNSLFDCHAFWCSHKKTAQEVTCWLLKTFLQVFNDLQRKRKDRQDRKLRKQQDAAMGIPHYPAPPISPDGKMNLAMYSVIFEEPNSKGQGAAVRLTRNRPQTIGPTNPTAHRPPPDADYPNHVNGLTTNATSHYQTPPSHHLRPSAQTRGRPPRVNVMPPAPLSGDPYSPDDDVFTHDPRPLTIVNGRSQSLNTGGSKNGYPSGGQYQPHQLPSAMGPNNNHLLAPPPSSRARYDKKHSPTRYSSTVSSEVSPASGSGSSMTTRDSGKEGDFIFIDMLQEAFSEAGDAAPAPGDKNARGHRARRQSGTSSASTCSDPLGKLTSENIERRIRQWLIEGEEPNNNVPSSKSGYSDYQYARMYHHQNNQPNQGPAFRYLHHQQQQHLLHQPGGNQSNGWTPPSIPSGNAQAPSGAPAKSGSSANPNPHAIGTFYGMSADENYF